MTTALSQPWWALLTRLGEAQLLLPVAALAMWSLLRRRAGRPLAGWWLGSLAVAVLATTASKVAFIGWGLGWPALDFTGISGHAMFAAAIYPVLLACLVPPAVRGGTRSAVAAGAALALLVGISRLVVGAHSSSEVVAGLALGAGVSALALGRWKLPPLRPGLRPLAVAALWLALTPAYAPASRSHDFVTRLALALSGHELPHRRGEWRGPPSGRAANGGHEGAQQVGVEPP